VKADKHERAATQIDGDAGSITGSPLTEVNLLRRRFLREIGRWSAALAVVGLGPEVWMRFVSRRSIISNAVAAEALRNRQLHPFPEDDPYNMPLGSNVVYASPNEIITSKVIESGGSFNVNSGYGWSHPIYFATTADPITNHRLVEKAMDWNRGVRSYRPEEDGQKTMNERLPIDAVQAGFGADTWHDGALHIIFENELCEFYMWKRDGVGLTTANCRKIVRNRLDHYSYGVGSVKQPDGSWKWLTSDNDPLRNMASGASAWGGSAIAGLIREAEIDGPNPHIPHALRLQLRSGEDVTGYQQGDPSSPAYNYNFVFPATASDATSAMSPTGKYSDPRHGYAATGSARMGMRFALDPTIVTDAWINANAPRLSDGSINRVQVAVAKALRDYGCLVADDGPSKNSIAAQEFMRSDLASMLRQGGWQTGHWNWLRPHLRRVYAPGVQVPRQDHWRSWAKNREGWGGGAPRVPYSRPLAPISGDVPPPPEAPGAIEVSGGRASGRIG
jgi:hypothetical protein